MPRFFCSDHNNCIKHTHSLCNTLTTIVMQYNSYYPVGAYIPHLNFYYYEASSMPNLCHIISHDTRLNFHVLCYCHNFQIYSNKIF